MFTAEERWKRQKLEQKRRKKRKFRCRILGVTVLLLAGAVLFYERKTDFYEDEADGWIGAVSQYSEWIGKDEGGSSGSDNSKSAELLVLVNKDHPLPDNYSVELHELKNGSCSVAACMYDALAAMLSDGTDAGGNFVVASAYRDAAYQQQLLEEDVAASMAAGLSWEEAYEKETRETMPPGCSEHATGLAVDLVALDYQILDAQQARTMENQWLQEHCSEYGFILRYPKEKEAITGISYEPWHFRYVGEQAEREIMNKGITLEEYLE